MAFFQQSFHRVVLFALLPLESGEAGEVVSQSFTDEVLVRGVRVNHSRLVGEKAVKVLLQRPDFRCKFGSAFGNGLVKKF